MCCMPGAVCAARQPASTGKPAAARLSHQLTDLRAGGPLHDQCSHPEPTSPSPPIPPLYACIIRSPPHPTLPTPLLRQGREAIGAHVAEAHGDTVEWGHLQADVVQYGGGGKQYEILADDSLPHPAAGRGGPASASGQAGRSGGPPSHSDAALPPRWVLGLGKNWVCVLFLGVQTNGLMGGVACRATWGGDCPGAGGKEGAGRRAA